MNLKSFTLLFAVCLFGINTFSQLPKGDRILAYQVDMAENGDYDSAFAYADKACAESIHMFTTWSGIESDAGVFEADGISYLDITNIYFPAMGSMVEMQLAPLNTVAKEVPADLMGVDFDDPIMINRFKVFLDTFFAHVPDVELAALNIGNEHDVYFGTDAAQYTAFKVFLDSVVPYAKAKYFALHGTDLKVGTTFTFDGLLDATKGPLCAGVNSGLDIVSTTYYPLEGDFTMEDPAVVFEDFDTIVALYNDPAQPIYFAECGFASSDSCNSSEEQQADFFSNVFQAWDDHYDNIKYVTIFKTTDWSQDDVDTLAVYYAIATTEFKEYLRTLGIRTFPGDGTDKLAYDRIKCLLAERDWCAPLECVGVNLEEEEVITSKAYPNPATDYILIDLSNHSESQNYQVVLSTVNGQKVREMSFQDATLKIDVSDLERGIYLMSIQSDQNLIMTKRIVLK